MNTAILEVLISVISSFLGVNLKDIKASLNKENLKTCRPAKHSRQHFQAGRIGQRQAVFVPTSGKRANGYRAFI